jgi:hypothetical protein
MRTALAVLLAASSAAASSAYGQTACTAASGPRTTALVDLYTSEGCSSCPPADRWLSGLAERGLAPGKVVPLSLHVDYWDYIGWKDRFAKGEFSSRQRKLTKLQRLAFVYTPQVMLQGQDFRRWHTAAFDEAVARINAEPARAKISLAIRSIGPGGIEAEAVAELLDPGHTKDAALYLAAFENKLVSQVGAGGESGPAARARLRRAGMGRSPPAGQGRAGRETDPAPPSQGRSGALRGGGFRAEPALGRGPASPDAPGLPHLRAGAAG